MDTFAEQVRHLAEDLGAKADMWTGDDDVVAFREAARAAQFEVHLEAALRQEEVS